MAISRFVILLYYAHKEMVRDFISDKTLFRGTEAVEKSFVTFFPFEI